MSWELAGLSACEWTPGPRSARLIACQADAAVAKRQDIRAGLEADLHGREYRQLPANNTPAPTPQSGDVAPQGGSCKPRIAAQQPGDAISIDPGRERPERCLKVPALATCVLCQPSDPIASALTFWHLAAVELAPSAPLSGLPQVAWAARPRTLRRLGLRSAVVIVVVDRFDPFGLVLGLAGY
jgi:hypothetical protein